MLAMLVDRISRCDIRLRCHLLCPEHFLSGREQVGMVGQMLIDRIFESLLQIIELTNVTERLDAERVIGGHRRRCRERHARPHLRRPRVSRGPQRSRLASW